MRRHSSAFEGETERGDLEPVEGRREGGADAPQCDVALRLGAPRRGDGSRVGDCRDVAAEVTDYAAASAYLSRAHVAAWAQAGTCLAMVLVVAASLASSSAVSGPWASDPSAPRGLAARGVAGLYGVGFLMALRQNRALVGSGPVAAAAAFDSGKELDAPKKRVSLDAGLDVVAASGLACAAPLFLFGAGGGPGWLALAGCYACYLSLATVGAPFYSYGWESQLLETTALCLLPQSPQWLGGALVASGNLSFLNYLTMVPALMCFDDAFLGSVGPAAAAPFLQRTLIDNPLAVALGALLLWLNRPTYENLAAPARRGDLDGRRPARQAMNSTFDRVVDVRPAYRALGLSDDAPRPVNLRAFRLANAFGAFGSVNDRKNALVVEGKRDGEDWREYDFRALPADPTAKLRQLATNDEATSSLLNENPFAAGDPPSQVPARPRRGDAARVEVVRVGEQRRQGSPASAASEAAARAAATGPARAVRGPGDVVAAPRSAASDAGAQAGVPTARTRLPSPSGGVYDPSGSRRDGEGDRTPFSVPVVRERLERRRLSTPSRHPADASEQASTS
ncbi:hypothetical protein JL721_10728 [Aureococcus anophagefferens]|nr:hypothetical protein JL721_10728 [Aureococcus anophagefferens]